MLDRTQLITILNQYFSVGGSDVYCLTRVKKGALGTVTLDNFVEFGEENVANLTDYLLKNLKPNMLSPTVIHSIESAFATRLKRFIHEDDFEQLCCDCAVSEEDVFHYIDQVLRGESND